jgi:hypothetical protein
MKTNEDVDKLAKIRETIRQLQDEEKQIRERLLSEVDLIGENFYAIIGRGQQRHITLESVKKVLTAEQLREMTTVRTVKTERKDYDMISGRALFFLATSAAFVGWLLCAPSPRMFGRAKLKETDEPFFGSVTNGTNGTNGTLSKNDETYVDFHARRGFEIYNLSSSLKTVVRVSYGHAKLSDSDRLAIDQILQAVSGVVVNSDRESSCRPYRETLQKTASIVAGVGSAPGGGEVA